MSDLPSFVTKGPPFEMRRTIEAVIKAGLTEQKVYERNGRIYAGTSGFCSRQTALSATFHGEVTETATGKTYMAQGNALEAVVMQGLENQARLLFKQYKTMDIGINLGGYIDGIIVHQGKIRGLEVKTCSELPGHPHEEHIAQARMYEAITGLPFTILYFSRSVMDRWQQLKIKGFDLNSTEEDLRTVLYNASYAYHAIDAGVIPPRPGFTKRGDCGFCQFVPYCWDKEPISSSLTPVTSAKHRELVEKTSETVDRILAKENVEARRNGMLKHLSINGTQVAIDLLSGTDWSTLL